FSSVLSCSSASAPALPSFPTRRSSDLLTQPDIAQRFLNINILRQLAVQLQLVLHGRVLELRARIAESLVLPGTLRQYKPRHQATDRKSTRLNSSHVSISYAVFCLKKKN